MYYVFDGTYAGFLCCVFESFENKEFEVIPLLQEDRPVDFFIKSKILPTDASRAQRVHRGLQKRLGKSAAFDFFRVFLSEDRKAWVASFNLIHLVFTGQHDILQNYGNEEVLYFSQTLKKVGREHHRMKAFVRFQKSSDGLYFSMIEPDFNVLPLIAGFFRKRYADQKWLIYDVKRKYGLLYDRLTVSEVELSPEERQALSADVAISLDEQDEDIQKLWKRYYVSTNIEARKNMKLHLQHVPRRYWKYLVEKQL
jgi:probable DNA metabolism protein